MLICLVPFEPPPHTGVIGAGRIGRVHLETLAGVPGVQPVILSDVVEPVLKEVRWLLPMCRV
jgi:hypothetical protein